MRAGATAAWSVPLVQVVAAAPAFAVQSPATTVLFTSLTGAYLSSTSLKVTGSVTNSGPSVPTVGLQVSLTLPASATGVASAPVGWSVTGSGTDWVLTADAQAGPLTPKTFDLTFTVPTGGGGDLLGSVFATNAESSGTSAVVASGQASKPVLALSGFTGAYGADAGTLAVNATVTNTGSASTNGLKLAVTLPAGKYNQAPSATAPDGWSAPVVTGSGSGPWTLEYTASAQVAPNANRSLSTTITLDDSSAAKKYAGTGYQISASATASNATDPATGTATVAAAGTSTLSIVKPDGSAGYTVTEANGSGGSKVSTLRAKVRDAGPKTVSDVRLKVVCTKTVTNVSVAAGTGWSVESVSDMTMIFRYAADLATGSTTSDVGATYTTQGSSSVASVQATATGANPASA